MPASRTLDELRKQVRDSGIRPERPSSSNDHLATQIERLERTQLTLERQLHDVPLSPVQRVRLQKKCDVLGDKVNKLRTVMNQQADDARFGLEAKDSHRALAMRLRRYIDEQRADESQSAPQDVDRVQRWLAILIRERRAALGEIQERVYQARRYVLRATIQLDEVASPDVGETSAAEIRTHIGMAEEAVRDALDDLILLAHHWSELRSIARRRDWGALPFARLKEELASIVEGVESAQAPDAVQDDGQDADATRTTSGDADISTTRINGLRDEFKATAIWLQELRTAVQSVPPPFSSSSPD